MQPLLELKTQHRFRPLNWSLSMLQHYYTSFQYKNTFIQWKGDMLSVSHLLQFVCGLAYSLHGALQDAGRHYLSWKPSKSSCTVRNLQLVWGPQYGWPPCTNYFRLAAFDIANNIYFLAKQHTLMRRSSVQNHPLQLVFPGLYLNY